jgi:hypothetical protein
VSTDFFDELGQHLDRAARRQARWGRLATAPLPSAGAVMAVLLVGLVVAAGAWSIPHLAGDDAELPAGPAPTLTPTPAAPQPYGCDGPVHPETRELFKVIRDGTPDESLKFTAPDGVTFLSGPVLARELAGHRFWLIPAATPPDCAEPLICVVTDFGVDAVSCSLLPERRRSAPLVTRVDFSAPEGEPNIVFFAAAPDGMADVGVEQVELSFAGNLLAAAVHLPEEDARRLGEKIGGRQLP